MLSGDSITIYITSENVQLCNCDSVIESKNHFRSAGNFSQEIMSILSEVKRTVKKHFENLDLIVRSSEPALTLASIPKKHFQ